MNRLKRRIDKACGRRTALQDSIFLDAMLPEFKAANAELLKAIKMNDKSGAIPYTELLEINKAMKANDAEKAGQALKKVQAKLNKAEKVLDEEIKTATAKLAESKKAREASLQALKSKKAVAQIFEKAKAACDSARQSPKSASKLTALTDKIKEYGDLSKRASQIVTMSASGKDISKQIDLLKKSIEASEKKYKKDLAAIEQSAKRSKDEFEKISDGQKIAQGKRDAFQKERLHLANVVKQMPSGDLRQNRGGGIDYNAIAAELHKKYTALYDAAEKEVNKIVSLYKERSFDREAYSKDVKKLIWNAYESINAKHPNVSKIIKSAYKYGSFNDMSNLISEIVKAKNEIKNTGDSPQAYLGQLIDFIKETKAKYEASKSYPDGITANDASMINFHAKNNIADAVTYLFDYVEPYKSKGAKVYNEYKELREKAKSEKIKLPRMQLLK